MSTTNTCTASKNMLTYILIFVLVILILYIVIYIIRLNNSSKKVITEQELIDNFVNNEQQITKKHKIVGLFMEGCGHCINFKPIFKKVTDEFMENATFKQKWDVVVENNTSVAKNVYNISAFPSVAIVKDNKVVATHTGSASEANFKSFLNQHIMTNHVQ